MSFSHEVCFNSDNVDLTQLTKNVGQQQQQQQPANNNNSSTQAENEFYALLVASNILPICADDSNLRQLNVEQETSLKILIRNSIWDKDHFIRKFFWTNLSVVIEQKFVAKQSSPVDYNAVIDHIMGKERTISIEMPKFARSADQKLNYYFLNPAGRQRVKQILCALEYHYPEITFCPIMLPICSLLLHYMTEGETFHLLTVLYKSNDHLLLTKKSWKSSSLILKKLLKKNFKSDYQRLLQNTNEPLELLFQDWYLWIFNSLSFDYLIRILDCYLYEGQKIFFRIGLVLVHSFARTLKAKDNMVNKEALKGFVEKNNFKSVNQLLTMSYNIRNFKRSYIHKLNLKFQKLPTADTVDTFEPQNERNVFLKETKTSTLSHSNLTAIWNWLPDRLTLYQPEVLFSTDVNGTSMKTLLNVLDELEYCFIVVKTLQNEVFGAFCSCEWIERRNKKVYFGTGETFLFTIEPHENVYNWVGKKVKETEANQEMFVRVKHAEKIAIGGGDHDGLSINYDLTSGTSNRCLTFDNEPLSSAINFEISCLEIIGFTN